MNRISINPPLADERGVSIKQHIAIVQRTAHRLQAEPLTRSALQPTQLQPFTRSLSRLTAVVHALAASHPARGAHIVHQTLPSVARVVTHRCLLRAEFAAVRSFSLRVLLLFHTVCRCHACDACVIRTVTHVAAYLLPNELRTLLHGLAWVAHVPSSTSIASVLLRRTPPHDDERFVNLLHAILRGSAQRHTTHHLPPHTCLATISSLSSLFYRHNSNRAHLRQPFLRPLLTVFRHHAARIDDATDFSRLFFLLACASVLRFINNVSHHHHHVHKPITSHPLCKPLIQFVNQILATFEPQICALVHTDHLNLFHSSHTTSISIIFIISSISLTASKFLSSARIQLIRRSIQTCMQTTKGTILHQHSKSTVSHAALHHHICRAITTHSNTLASAYANFIQQERSFQTAIHFLSSLVSPPPASQSTFHFVLIVIATTTVTPDIAVAYASILSFFDFETPLLQLTVIPRLSSSVASDDQATKALVQLTTVVLVNSSTSVSDIHRRLLFLVRFLSQVLSIRDGALASTVSSPKCVLDEDAQNLWQVFVREMIAVIQTNLHSEHVVSAAVQCLSQLVGQRDICTKLAAEHLKSALTTVLVATYLFRDISTVMEKRLLHVVLFLDAVATTTFDRESFKAFLTTLVESADKQGVQADRIVGVLLLRCLTQCDEKVVSVALGKLTSFIGTSTHRKETFLPLVRAAVLGLDTGKKDVCVVWIMRLFGDLRQRQSPNASAAATVGTNMRAAKL
eukprot:gb/GEZJ01002494.1/.p1 GENE.gb/GEZJ01002494.1/~~gb/GEZJ01002494.1/.p1  ORF type:complete len:743 (-),score=71.05 gb/GEZJ01002494.1/:4738-6966(-)